MFGKIVGENQLVELREGLEEKMRTVLVGRGHAAIGHELAVDGVSALVGDDGEILESSVVASVEQHAGSAGKTNGEAAAVTVGCAAGQNVGAAVGGIEQGVEFGLIVFAKAGENIVEDVARVGQRSDGRSESRGRDRHVPFVGGLAAGRQTIVALDFVRANSLVADGNVSMLRHSGEQAARFFRLKVEVLVFARGGVGVVVRLGEKSLRLDGVQQREREQVALAGVSGKTALEALFADAGVEVGGDEVALADYVELAGRGFHFSERNAGDDLVGEIVLPIADLRLELVEERLLGFRQQMRAVAAYLGKREAIRGERGLFVEEPAEPVFWNCENFGIEEGGFGVYVGFECLIGIAGGIVLPILGAAQMQVALVLGEKSLDGIIFLQGAEQLLRRVELTSRAG